MGRSIGLNSKPNLIPKLDFTDGLDSIPNLAPNLKLLDKVVCLRPGLDPPAPLGPPGGPPPMGLPPSGPLPSCQPTGQSSHTRSAQETAVHVLSAQETAVHVLSAQETAVHELSAQEAAVHVLSAACQLLPPLTEMEEELHLACSNNSPGQRDDEDDDPCSTARLAAAILSLSRELQAVATGVLQVLPQSELAVPGQSELAEPSQSEFTGPSQSLGVNARRRAAEMIVGCKLLEERVLHSEPVFQAVLQSIQALQLRGPRGVSSSPLDVAILRSLMTRLMLEGYHPTDGGNSFSAVLTRQEKLVYLKDLRSQERGILGMMRDVLQPDAESPNAPEVQLSEEELQQDSLLALVLRLQQQGAAQDEGGPDSRQGSGEFSTLHLDHEACQLLLAYHPDASMRRQTYEMSLRPRGLVSLAGVQQVSQLRGGEAATTFTALVAEQAKTPLRRRMYEWQRHHSNIGPWDVEWLRQEALHARLANGVASCTMALTGDGITHSSSTGGDSGQPKGSKDVCKSSDVDSGVQHNAASSTCIGGGRDEGASGNTDEGNGSRQEKGTAPSGVSGSNGASTCLSGERDEGIGSHQDKGTAPSGVSGSYGAGSFELNLLDLIQGLSRYLDSSMGLRLIHSHSNAALRTNPSSIQQAQSADANSNSNSNPGTLEPPTQMIALVSQPGAPAKPSSAASRSMLCFEVQHESRGVVGTLVVHPDGGFGTRYLTHGDPNRDSTSPNPVVLVGLSCGQNPAGNQAFQTLVSKQASLGPQLEQSMGLDGSAFMIWELLHELGHAMHFLLSSQRTPVEVPQPKPEGGVQFGSNGARGEVDGESGIDTGDKGKAGAGVKDAGGAGRDADRGGDTGVVGRHAARGGVHAAGRSGGFDTENGMAEVASGDRVQDSSSYGTVSQGSDSQLPLSYSWDCVLNTGSQLPLELLELPSTLFEMMSMDPRVLQVICSDLSWEETCALAAAIRSKFYSPIGFQLQVISALLDQLTIQQQLPAQQQSNSGTEEDVRAWSPGVGSTARKQKRDQGKQGPPQAVELWLQLHASFLPMLPPMFSSLQTRAFIRFMEGQGQTYGYFVAWCLAISAWELHMSKDPMDATAGRTLRRLAFESPTLLSVLSSDGPPEWLSDLVGPEVLQRASKEGGYIPRVDAALVRKYMAVD
eukprot:gene16223-22388_t